MIRVICCARLCVEGRDLSVLVYSLVVYTQLILRIIYSKYYNGHVYFSNNASVAASTAVMRV